MIGLVALLGACSQGQAKSEKVVIYTNADEEPAKVIEKTLDNNGYKNKYILQSLGTSELGGKLLAEGNKIEADLITMSTFYSEGAQAKNQLFKEVTPEVKALQETSPYAYPMTVQEGVIFYNTAALKEAKLTTPKSFKDLAQPEYKGQLSIPDINSSSTAWLFVQALLDTYGEAEAQTILKGIYANAGAHVEDSGSGPLKKVRVGEVAIGFGLRHQAIKDQKEGLPIDYVEPTEGTFTLTESLSVIDKGDKTNPEAEKMLALILTKARPEILKIYPNALYEGESMTGLQVASQVKAFSQPLTPELLQEHQKLVEQAKGN